MRWNPQVTTIKTVKQMDELVDMGGENTAWHKRWRIKLSNLFHQVEYKHCEIPETTTTIWPFHFRWSFHQSKCPAQIIISLYTTVQTFGVSKFVFLIYTFIQQACIKLIKGDRKHIYNVTKDLYLNSVLLKIQFRILKKSIMFSKVILSSTRVKIIKSYFVSLKTK